MKYKLKDIAKIKYGKNQKKVVFLNGNIPIYGTGGLMGYAKESLYEKPSVLIGRKGTINKVRYVTHPFWTVDTLFYTIIDEKIIRPHYFYYLMTQINLLQLNEGTTIPSLRTETLNRIELEVPSLEKQDEILSCVEPIEQKIELNQKINNNLEPHPCNARIAAKQRRQIPKPDGCLHTDDKVSDRDGNEETAKQFSSLLAA